MNKYISFFILLIFFVQLAPCEIINSSFVEINRNDFDKGKIDAETGATKKDNTYIKDYLYFNQNNFRISSEIKYKIDGKDFRYSNKAVNFYRLNAGYKSDFLNGTDFKTGYEKRTDYLAKDEDYDFGYFAVSNDIMLNNLIFSPELIYYFNQYNDDNDANIFSQNQIAYTINKNHKLYSKIYYYSDLNDSNYYDYWSTEFGSSHYFKLNKLIFSPSFGIGYNAYNSDLDKNFFLTGEFYLKYYLSDKLNIKLENYYKYILENEENRYFTNKTDLYFNYLINLGRLGYNKAYLYYSFNNKGIMDYSRYGIGTNFWIYKFNFDVKALYKNSDFLDALTGEGEIKYRFHENVSIFVNYQYTKYYSNSLKLSLSDKLVCGAELFF